MIAVLIAVLIAGLLAGYGIAMPVGAVATYLVALTARTSLRIGVFAALGVATADGLYALIAVTGGSTVTPLIEPVLVPLRWASASVLIMLALWSGVTAVRQFRGQQTATRTDMTPLTPVRAYMGLLAITMMNPLTVIYFAALLLGSNIATAATHVEQAVFVFAAFAASASWQLLLAGGGSLLGRTLTGSRGRLITTMISSSLITALAIHLVISPAGTYAQQLRAYVEVGVAPGCLSLCLGVPSNHTWLTCRPGGLRNGPPSKTALPALPYLAVRSAAPASTWRMPGQAPRSLAPSRTPCRLARSRPGSSPTLSACFCSPSRAAGVV